MYYICNEKTAEENEGSHGLRLIATAKKKADWQITTIVRNWKRQENADSADVEEWCIEKHREPGSPEAKRTGARTAPPTENKNGGEQYALSLPCFNGTPNVCVL